MSSTCLELRPLAIQPNDLLRPLGAFEELFSLFDQCFPNNGALTAQIIGHTTVQQWRDALDAVQQRHPLLSACIDTTSNCVPHFRRVTGQRIPLRVVTSPGAQWQREIAEEVPDIWKAAVEEYRIINWSSMLKSLAPFLNEYLKALLVLQGDNDPRVPKEEAQQGVDIITKEGPHCGCSLLPK